MLLTYVIPAYNASDTMGEAIGSIFDGNFLKEDKIIIVNDASTDSTLDVAREWQVRYPEVITIITNPENKGCPASRNIGIRSADTELIFNLDADNILTPESIILLRNALITEAADVAAFGEYWYFKDTTNSITHRWLCKTGVFTLADLFAGHVNQGPGGNFLYRKDLWERVGGYWEYGKGLHEAWGYSLKVLLAGAKFIVVPHTHYFHRYSHESLFMRESKKADEEARVTAKFIMPALETLDHASRAYVETHPNWYQSLDRHPLRLADGSVGVNVRILWTSPYRNILYRLKRLVSS